MDRTDFLKNLAGATVAPTLLKDLLDVKDEKVIITEPLRKRVAIDIQALNCGVLGPGGRKIPPKELLKIYFETGVLLYKRQPDMGPDYNPITVLE